MFVEAVELAAKFTRAIHSIIRYFGSSTVIPGSATLILVNPDGWALTCGHVAQQLKFADDLASRRSAYEGELTKLANGRANRKARDALRNKYGFRNGEIYDLRNTFVSCVDKLSEFDIVMHPSHDIALIRFKGFSKVLCDTFPKFASDDSALKPGKTLCRLGFPFPEFSNFEYDQNADEIRWAQTGRQDSPRFPIEGMVTRHVVDRDMNILGFEMSTPGLRGQSGGPAFDSKGVVWGVQSKTKHLDLDFDVDAEVLRKGKTKKVTHNAFLHVGRCVHVSLLKAFMRDHGVAFDEDGSTQRRP